MPYVTRRARLAPTSVPTSLSLGARALLVAVSALGSIACSSDDGTTTSSADVATADTLSPADAVQDNPDTPPPGEVTEADGAAEGDVEDDAVTTAPCRGAVADGALQLDCDGVVGALTPYVVLAGERVTGTCEGVDGALSCAVAGGTLRLADGAGWTLGFTASAPVAVGGMGLQGTVAVGGAKGWLSNGFQSWSMSGALALRAAPPEEARTAALAAMGDPETLRGGEELSWWWTAVGGGPATFVAGVTTANTWRSWVTVDGTDPAALSVALSSGGGEVALAAGEHVAGEAWFVGAGSDGVALLGEYGDAIPSRRAAPLRAEAGWNSWYDLWDGVDADAVLQNAALARTAFTAGGLPATTPLRIVVDDGWQEGWGRWLPNDKFPGGLEALAATLHGQGFEVGVWLAPLLVDAKDPVVAEHPDWFVGDLAYPHAVHGPMRVLDVTHPEAAAYLREAIKRLAAWGLDFLKIDFLFAGTWEGPRHVSMPGMAAYRQALALIRDAAGPDVTLLAVGAPPVAGFDLVDGWRLGPDIALEAFGPSWAFIAPQARNLAVRWPMCTAVACDADPPILRVLSQNEVSLGAWVAALAGGAYFLSDDLRALDAERHGWAFSPALLETALAGVSARPEGLFPAQLPGRLSNAIEDAIAGSSAARLPPVWRTPAGKRVVLNVGDEPLTVEGEAVPGRSAALLP